MCYQGEMQPTAQHLPVMPSELEGSQEEQGTTTICICLGQRQNLLLRTGRTKPPPPGPQMSTYFSMALHNAQTGAREPRGQPQTVSSLEGLSSSCSTIRNMAGEIVNERAALWVSMENYGQCRLLGGTWRKPNTKDQAKAECFHPQEASLATSLQHPSSISYHSGERPAEREKT